MLRRLAAAAALVLLVGALAIGAAHADDHRLHAPDGCAVCRHARTTPVIVHEAAAFCLQWVVLPAAVASVPAPRPSCAGRVRARGPPVVS